MKNVLTWLGLEWTWKCTAYFRIQQEVDGKLKRDDWKGFNIAIIYKVWPRQGKPVRDGEALQSSTVRGHYHPLT